MQLIKHTVNYDLKGESNLKLIAFLFCSFTEEKKNFKWFNTLEQ